MNVLDKMNCFCKNVQWLRLQARLEKDVMASLMGISREKLEQIEKGECARLDVMTLVRVCNYFNLDANTLLNELLNEKR